MGLFKIPGGQNFFYFQKWCKNNLCMILLEFFRVFGVKS
jgi:hypothetical protein